MARHDARYRAVYRPEDAYDMIHRSLTNLRVLLCCGTGDLASKFKGYDDEEEEDEDEMMAVEGSDGQQYVVLEVIQLADNQGADQVHTFSLCSFLHHDSSAVY